MKKFIAIMATAALLLSALLTVVPAFAETKAVTKEVTVPEGYDPNGYLKLRAFFEIEDENGVKNGDKLWTYTPEGDWEGWGDVNVYDPNVPETWKYEADSFHPGIYWRENENGIKYVSEIDLRIWRPWISDGDGDEIVGKLDISGMGALEMVKFPDGNISELNTEGCSIKCLYCSSTLRKIDWHCDEEDIEIHLQSSGEGFVGIDYYSDYSGIKEIDNWYIEAAPAQDGAFIGWYDNDGNCVSTDLKYVFCVAENDCPDEENNACPPAGSHLNLEARFEGESTPTEVPPTEPTPEPQLPATPGTGFISLAAIGVSAVIAGAGVVLFRKRK